MPTDVGAKITPGWNSAENCPEQLDLETGVPDDDRATLDPGHPRFGLFAFAWRWQDCWALAVHADFWRGAIDLWPRRTGGERVREQLAWALRAARRHGLTDAEAASTLGYQLDSLRKMNILSLAGEESGDGSAPGLPTFAVTDYVLPRVYGPDDPIPSSAAYPNLDPTDMPRDGSARAEQLAAALSACFGER